MAVRFLVASPPGDWTDLGNDTTPSGSGYEKGEAFLLASGDSVGFAFSKAATDDIISGPLGGSPDQAIASFEDRFTVIVKCPHVKVTGAGSATFSKGDDVFLELTDGDVVSTKTTSSYWIGKSAQTKGSSDTTFFMDYDGTNPNRSSS